MNVVGAILGIVLLLLGIAVFPLTFVFPEEFRIPFFLFGILLVASSFGLPILLLDKLDR